MKKRTLSLALALVLLVGILAGCAPKNNGEDSSGSPDPSETVSGTLSPEESGVPETTPLPEESETPEESDVPASGSRRWRAVSPLLPTSPLPSLLTARPRSLPPAPRPLLRPRPLPVPLPVPPPAAWT